jgi:hypothetical protein
LVIQFEIHTFPLFAKLFFSYLPYHNILSGAGYCPELHNRLDGIVGEDSLTVE